MNQNLKAQGEGALLGLCLMLCGGLASPNLQGGEKQ